MQLVQETYLSSPVPTVLERIVAGDVLELKIRMEGQRRVVVALKGGEIAGSVVCRHLHRLLECMSKGFRYQAHVRERSGGRCHVEIRPALSPP
jgi:hypothetical protein